MSYLSEVVEILASNILKLKFWESPGYHRVIRSAASAKDETRVNTRF